MQKAHKSPAASASEKAGSGGRRASAVADIERAMLKIRRSQTRRTLGRALEAELGKPVPMNAAFVVDAVAEGEEQGAEEKSAATTIGDVALRLGIDPSRASRMVKEAIDEGYVRREASAADGRASLLVLTATGRTLDRAMRTSRRKALTRAVAGFSESDVATLAKLLTRFVGRG